FPAHGPGLPLGLIPDARHQFRLRLAGGKPGGALQHLPALVLEPGQFAPLAVQLLPGLLKGGGTLLQRLQFPIQAPLPLGQPDLAALQVGPQLARLVLGVPEVGLGVGARLRDPLGRLLGAADAPGPRPGAAARPRAPPGPPPGGPASSLASRRSASASAHAFAIRSAASSARRTIPAASDSAAALTCSAARPASSSRCLASSAAGPASPGCRWLSATCPVVAPRAGSLWGSSGMAPAVRGPDRRAGMTSTGAAASRAKSRITTATMATTLLMAHPNPARWPGCRPVLPAIPAARGYARCPRRPSWRATAIGGRSWIPAASPFTLPKPGRPGRGHVLPGRPAASNLPAIRASRGPDGPHAPAGRSQERPPAALPPGPVPGPAAERDRPRTRLVYFHPPLRTNTSLP